ncbi:MAG: Phosphoglycolate phosphatase [Chroococcidiopsis sp. SAG 2025]|uniref:HAD family hydrolase n=1 Tax=Chroococcidiopsis sp. SAG 2025 TaxID=171389 RepID=UPI002936EAF1|nr:HAD family phosphatase [Chroococcidiopsis sp. SAG 2025]MDV2994728.1 Phosphoglycolate phosphatase [Chroococcidiopsis sp. SAG 2025]
MAIEAVIFDIDGTLVDSVDFHAQSWEKTFQHFGHQIPYKQIRTQIGKGSDKLMPVFFSVEELNESDGGRSPTKGERMRDYRRELYKREYHPRIKAFPQVRELFLRIKADGKRIALASSATKDDLATYTQILNVEDLLDAATTTTEVESSKYYSCR